MVFYGEHVLFLPKILSYEGGPKQERGNLCSVQSVVRRKNALHFSCDCVKITSKDIFYLLVMIEGFRNHHHPLRRRFPQNI